MDRDSGDDSNDDGFPDEIQDKAKKEQSQQQYAELNVDCHFVGNSKAFDVVE